MTEKTAQQIAGMKEQTIGVEIEMNSITRKAAAQLAAAQTAPSTPTAEMDTTLGVHGMHRAENGNSRETAQLQDRMRKNANWSHRFCTTMTLKPCKSW